MLKIKKFSKHIRHAIHKKGVKFALVVELSKLNFTFFTVLKQPNHGPFNKDMLVGLEDLQLKKSPKICTCCKVSEAKFHLPISQY